MRKWLTISIICGLISLFSTIANSETIYLKSGEKVTGKIVAQSANSVMIQDEGGAYKSYSTEAIKEIKKEDAAEETRVKAESMQSVVDNEKNRADEMEIKFKELAKQIAIDLQTQASYYESKEKTEMSKEKSKIADRRIGECKNELKNLIKANPRSIWADDAQYIVTTLDVGNTKQHALDLEILLKEHPNMHIENWTKETLVRIMPNPNLPLEESVKIQLGFDYKELGETEKLKLLCEESIKKYPDKANVFEKLAQTNSK